MAFDAMSFVQPLASDHTSVAKIVVADLTFDADYVDGGALVNKARFGLSEVWFASVEQVLAASGSDNAYRFVYNYADDKVQAFVDNDAGASDEVAESTGSSAINNVVVRIFLYGLSS